MDKYDFIDLGKHKNTESCYLRQYKKIYKLYDSRLRG